MSLTSSTPWYLRLLHHRSAVFGLIILFFFSFSALFAPLLSSYDPLEQDLSSISLAPFSKGHLLGTDELGRDLFTRIIYGGRLSLLIGFISVGIGILLGGSLGLAAGYFGSWFDTVVMRFIDILLAFPYILLTIVIVALLGSSLENAMLAIGLAQLPKYVRVIRTNVMSVKQEDYILAERALGTPAWRLMLSSILPNAFAPSLVQATLGVGSAILSSAGLSFLGLGAQPPTPEWGLMIASSREFVTSAWWIVTFPGLAILFVVIGFNLFGDGLRDVLDPQQS